MKPRTRLAMSISSLGRATDAGITGARRALNSRALNETDQHVALNRTPALAVVAGNNAITSFEQPHKVKRMHDLSVVVPPRGVEMLANPRRVANPVIEAVKQFSISLETRRPVY